MEQLPPLNVSRGALISVAHVGFGGVAGAVVDTMFPQATEDSATSTIATQLALQGAAMGVVSAISDRTWMQAIDPTQQAGGGMFFMGLVVASPEFKAKTELLIGRGRVFFRNLVKGLYDDTKGRVNEAINEVGSTPK